VKRNSLITWMAILLSASSVGAGERCYLLVFSAQCPHINPAHRSHSWGTFVRVHDCESHGGSAYLESVTISWFPKTLELQTLDFPKRGVNLSLHDTLRWAKDNGLRASLWGPYEIDPSLYAEAVNKATQLASGTVKYQLLDFRHPVDQVANCTRALGDIPMGSPKPRLGMTRGDEASHLLALNFSPWILDAETTHDWVISALGLNRLTLVRRYLEDCP
jgi:hypothetical protein